MAILTFVGNYRREGKAINALSRSVGQTSRK